MDDDDEVSPFSKRIRLCSMPHNFVMQEICKYEGRRDPYDHLLNYHANMEIFEATPALKCKASPRLCKEVLLDAPSAAGWVGDPSPVAIHLWPLKWVDILL
ncbi:hypothetical protein Fot_37463 [Forsythia ovata]|uniref:Uncharacterized protein n=1 Tax=Forsythia ovata TaxID=205694 RepID=A0ABD1RZ33_9LAMI